MIYRILLIGFPGFHLEGQEKDIQKIRLILSNIKINYSFAFSSFVCFK